MVGYADDVRLKPKNAHRSLWLGLGWILAGWALWQGVTYATLGGSQVHSPALYVLAHIPIVGIRVHGVAMILLAVVFIYELKETSSLTRWTLRILCGYCVLVAVSIVGSWWVTNTVTFGAPGFWIAFAAISGVMILFPPLPLRGSDDV